MTNRKRYKVIIIDDNDISRMLLRNILRSGGYEIIGEAPNATKGIEMIQTKKPDIVCLDNMMPDMNGLEMLLEIRPLFPNTLIVMITGNSDNETIQTALQRGVDGYVTKPYSIGTVLDTMEHTLNKKYPTNP